MAAERHSEAKPRGWWVRGAGAARPPKRAWQAGAPGRGGFVTMQGLGPGAFFLGVLGGHLSP